MTGGGTTKPRLCGADVTQPSINSIESLPRTSTHSVLWSRKRSRNRHSTAHSCLANFQLNPSFQMEALPSTGSTAEQLLKATGGPRNDQDSLPRTKDLSESATADAPIPDKCTPENPSSDSLPSLDQAFGDILHGTSMLFPTRPANPNIIHKVISILLYPTIFEDLYGKALKSDFVGVTGVLAGVTQGWDTNQSLVRQISQSDKLGLPK